MIVNGAVSVLAGATTALAFAPYELWLFALAGPLIVFVRWERDQQAVAFLHGFLFHVGLLATGGYWLYLTAGRLAETSIFVGVVLTSVFIAAMSLYMGVAGWLYAILRDRFSRLARILLLFPVLWVFAEWWRGWFMTGFPWFALGYSQTDTPLVGWAPVLGVYGVSFALAACAAVAAEVGRLDVRSALAALASVLAIWLVGAMLGEIHWVQPKSESIRVALVQFDKEQAPADEMDRFKFIVETSKDLMEDHDLIVWPEAVGLIYQIAFANETKAGFVAGERVLDRKRWQRRAFHLDKDRRDYAVPMRHEEMLLQPLEYAARRADAVVMVGLTLRDASSELYYNSIIVLDDLRRSVYDKRHLVPFGEIIPLRSALAPFWDWLQVHDSTYDWGRTRTNIVEAAGYAFGVSICYESAFADEIAEALPRADMLVMASDDRVYRGTTEPAQHEQIARMRAIESGRWVVRATATGRTAVISPAGAVEDTLAEDVDGVLSAVAQPMSGSTPFVVWGIWPILLVIGLTIAFGLMPWRSRTKVLPNLRRG